MNLFRFLTSNGESGIIAPYWITTDDTSGMTDPTPIADVEALHNYINAIQDDNS